MKLASPTILPGATLGILGGGQLGRMFVQAAARMGYRTIVFAPGSDSPAGHVAHEHMRADFEDEPALDAFARRCDAVTIEFENVPVSALQHVREVTPTRPGPNVLATAQDRLQERAFLDHHGFSCAPHAYIRSAEELSVAIKRVGTPAVLKCARLGYDGRGQTRINHENEAHQAWADLDVDAALYESWVDLSCEVSVLVARSSCGQIETFGPIENVHANHVLDVSTTPAAVSQDLMREAVDLACDVARALELEGLICVEMFVTRDGLLYVNELAPRPHNSGHLTIEACDVSQFEQQVRALCSLPLGSMNPHTPAAMVNLLGDLWADDEPQWAEALAFPGVSLHLYGKSQSRPGRKMGHITAIANSVGEARDQALAARRALRPPAGCKLTDDEGRPRRIVL